jgi:hypothetical protein
MRLELDVAGSAVVVEIASAEERRTVRLELPDS